MRQRDARVRGDAVRGDVRRNGGDSVSGLGVLGALGHHFCHVLPGAVIGERCNLGQNVVVMGGTRLGDNVKVQNNVSIYTGVEIADADEHRVGRQHRRTEAADVRQFRGLLERRHVRARVGRQLGRVVSWLGVDSYATGKLISGGIELVHEAVHRTVDGKRLLVARRVRPGKPQPAGFVRTADLSNWSANNGDAAFSIIQLFAPAETAGEKAADRHYVHHVPAQHGRRTIRA